MTEHHYPLTRRRALQMAVTIGTALAMRPCESWASDLGKLATKPIPSTGEQLPVIGIGTARRYDVAASEADLEPLREVVRHFSAFGGKVIDTAPSYGNAESVVGKLVSDVGNRSELFLATKVGRGSQGAQAGRDELEQSLKRLKVPKVDLMQVHNLGGVNEMLPIVKEWKDAGKTRYLGVTTSSKTQYSELENLIRTQRMDFIEVDYAIDNREVEQRILPLAAGSGRSSACGAPFWARTSVGNLRQTTRAGLGARVRNSQLGAVCAEVYCLAPCHYRRDPRNRQDGILE
jgi:aryl-alcohol dehydrogenase-like predicted oxidoreductase